MSAPKLLLLATEDWFVRSHFLPLLRRAQAEGYEIVVAARNSGALAGEGVRVADMPFARGSFGLSQVLREVAAVRALMRAETPDLVHVIALKPIALALLAGRSGAATAFALTGRGYLAVGAALWTRLTAGLLARGLRAALSKDRTLLLVENEADRVWVENGARLPDARVMLMPGAGVDVAAFAPQPPPHPGPIVVGVAARLVRSKGVDVAVEAVQRLRAHGADMELHIAGDADPENPEHVSDAELTRWRSMPGVRLLGRVTDIAGFWARAHIACFPSRGGEGLPRSMLEAGACGRPLVATDTPGCAAFVRQAKAGLVVAPSDAAALAAALKSLADDPERRRVLGEAARAHTIAGYTEQHAAACAAAAWRRLLGDAL